MPELGQQQPLHRKPYRRLRTRERHDDLAGGEARRGAAHHRRRSDLLEAQHPEELAEPVEPLLQQCIDRFERAVARRDASAARGDDRLRARIAEMGDSPDHQRLAAEVLGIRNAPPDLARRLVSQALVVEDRRDAWRLAGERICATAPATPGVYVLRDDLGRALYVGKAINLRRRLRTHFAGRRWRGLKAELARATDAEWHEVGSELEALLREAELIPDLAPIVNVQTGPPDLDAPQIPRVRVRDVIVARRSAETDSA